MRIVSIAPIAPIVALLLLPAAAPARSEDAAHRADRLRTQALNRQAAAVVARRQAADARQAAIDRAARADYERKLADYRRRAATRAAAMD